jgi:hypothetical protein
MSKDSRADRLLGLMVTISLGFLIYISANGVKQIIEKSNITNLFKNKKGDDDDNNSNEYDEIYKCRYKYNNNNNNNNNNNINHNGSCHCKRVKFRCKAPSRLQCVDIPTKLRFPRLTIPAENFELITDENLLSLYPIQHHSDNMGVYTFCSFCGMHILFAESLDPIDIQINVECLDKNNIENISVTYHSQSESIPCAIAYEPAQNVFEKRGLGSSFHPQFDTFMPFTVYDNDNQSPIIRIDKQYEHKDSDLEKTNSSDFDTVSSNNGSPKYSNNNNNNEENSFYVNSNDSKSDNKHINKNRISRPLESIELNTPMHHQLQSLSKYLPNTNNDDSTITTTI